MQHRLLTGCFAARLCSTNWKPGSSGRSRLCSSLKMRVINSDPRSFIKLLLLIIKIVLSFLLILQVVSTGAGEPAHKTSYSSWDKVKWNDGDMVVLMMGSKDEYMPEQAVDKTKFIEETNVSEFLSPWTCPLLGCKTSGTPAT